MTEPQSKFIGRFDSSATAENRRPAIAGTFALASDRIQRSFRAWSGKSAGGRIYLRGTHEPQGFTAAVKARFAPTQAGDAPPGIALKPGELVLFENQEMDLGKKQPSWYGFARTHESYVRLSAWDRLGDGGAKLLAGVAEPYRPGDTRPEDADIHPPAP